MESISFVIPTANNLKYLKNAYASVRKYAGNHHEIIVLDDNSSDGTGEWLDSVSDDNLVIWKNTKDRLGHTITYNIGAMLAKNEIFSILHADMYIGPNYVENALKHLERKTVVSATRIEPPLHPEGKEKIVRDFGLWPHTFNEPEFLLFVEQEQRDRRGGVTSGIFAPWFMYKEDFLAIGGHDPLFAPFPYEDSDLFQRLMLAGYRIIQSRDSLVYHLTCRGHKWTDDTKLGQHDNFFTVSEEKARRNYIRKWNSWIKNDEYHLPIVPPKYNTHAIVRGVKDINLLRELEVWFDYITIDNRELVDRYITAEQPNTMLNLYDRIRTDSSLTYHDVLVIFDVGTCNAEDYKNIQDLSLIIHEMQNSIELGETYELGNIQLIFSKVENKINDLIICPRETIYE